MELAWLDPDRIALVEEVTDFVIKDIVRIPGVVHGFVPQLRKTSGLDQLEGLVVNPLRRDQPINGLVVNRQGRRLCAQGDGVGASCWCCPPGV